jgi:hypothetical protein
VLHFHSLRKMPHGKDRCVPASASQLGEDERSRPFTKARLFWSSHLSFHSLNKRAYCASVHINDWQRPYEKLMHAASDESIQKATDNPGWCVLMWTRQIIGTMNISVVRTVLLGEWSVQRGQVSIEKARPRNGERGGASV